MFASASQLLVGSPIFFVVVVMVIAPHCHNSEPVTIRRVRPCTHTRTGWYRYTLRKHAYIETRYKEVSSKGWWLLRTTSTGSWRPKSGDVSRRKCPCWPGFDQWLTAASLPQIASARIAFCGFAESLYTSGDPPDPFGSSGTRTSPWITEVLLHTLLGKLERDSKTAESQRVDRAESYRFCGFAVMSFRYSLAGSFTHCRTYRGLCLKLALSLRMSFASKRRWLRSCMFRSVLAAL